jgi:hypothetical protein
MIVALPFGDRPTMNQAIARPPEGPSIGARDRPPFGGRSGRVGLRPLNLCKPCVRQPSSGPLGVDDRGPLTRSQGTCRSSRASASLAPLAALLQHPRRQYSHGTNLRVRARYAS